MRMRVSRSVHATATLGPRTQAKEVRLFLLSLSSDEAQSPVAALSVVPDSSVRGESRGRLLKRVTQVGSLRQREDSLIVAARLLVVDDGVGSRGCA